MREILFRAKSNAEQKWAYGDLLTIKYHDGTTDYSITEQSAVGGVTAVDPETIGQYTGFKDFHGNKIYEGDIVINEFDNIGRIEFREGEFILKRISNGEFVDGIRWYKKLKIIGNIYDNPELLEVEQ